jgi:hypothetical protein
MGLGVCIPWSVANLIILPFDVQLLYFGLQVLIGAELAFTRIKAILSHSIASWPTPSVQCSYLSHLL